MNYFQRHDDLRVLSSDTKYPLVTVELDRKYNRDDSKISRDTIFRQREYIRLVAPGFEDSLRGPRFCSPPLRRTVTRVVDQTRSKRARKKVVEDDRSESGAVASVSN